MNYEHLHDTRLTTAVIGSLALLMTVLLIASVLRRLLNERKYRTLDRLRRSRLRLRLVNDTRKLFLSF